MAVMTIVWCAKTESIEIASVSCVTRADTGWASVGLEELNPNFGFQRTVSSPSISEVLYKVYKAFSAIFFKLLEQTS